MFYDYLIIGAGPAGLQLAYYLERKKKNYMILEQGTKAGSFFSLFPRHRKLISINKIYTGHDNPETNYRWDWNSLLMEEDRLLFKEFSKEYFPNADKMVDYLEEFHKKNKLAIKFNSPVVKISRSGHFNVETQDGNQYQSKKLIVATGVSKPFIPDIPGIEKTVNYYDMSVDPNDYINKKVLIIGKGNSGFETADSLVAHASLIHIVSPTPLKFAWKTHYVGHLRAVNNNFLDTYQLKSQNVILNSHIKNIKFKNGKYKVEFGYCLANNEVEELEYDSVLVCSGFKFDASIFDKSCMPKTKINDRFPALTPHFESENINDLYFCGTIMQERDFKKEQSGFIHGFRYNIRFLDDYFNYRYDGKSLKNKVIAADAKKLTTNILKSVNSSSALWQQTGFLCDVVAWDPKLCKFRYYEGLPFDYLSEKDNFFSQFPDYFVVTLEFGQSRINKFPNVFAIERPNKNDFKSAHLSTGIHPIIRYYSCGLLHKEHHLLEDIDSVWKRDVHKEPLQGMLETIIKKLLPKSKRKTG